jgi:transposase
MIPAVRRRRRGWRFPMTYANASWMRSCQAACRAMKQPDASKVSIASAVRWVKLYLTTGEISPKPAGGDRRSGRIEAHRSYLLGLIHRTPDITLLEIQQRLVENCGERFAVSVLWRFFDRHGITFKKKTAMDSNIKCNAVD